MTTTIQDPGKATAAPLAPPVSIRSILFFSDLSPASDQAMEHARFLAECFGARLTLSHVVEVPPERDPEPWPTQDEVVRRAVRDAREHLERHAESLSTPNDILVEREPSLDWALVSQVRRECPDLVVMRTRAHAGLAHVFPGSLAEKVLQHGRAPVLCVREPEHGVPLPYRRILVPTDLSARSRRAFPLAAHLARRFDALVLALHVASVTAPTDLHGVPDAIEATSSEEALRAFMQPDFDDVRVMPRVLLGAAWDAIGATASTEHADLIVLSTHGHDSLGDRIVGSHADRVIRHSTCPVLVVP
jgi:nucleotide-binding universal stress UspA family protein